MKLKELLEVMEYEIPVKIETTTPNGEFIRIFYGVTGAIPFSLFRDFGDNAVEDIDMEDDGSLSILIH